MYSATLTERSFDTGTVTLNYVADGPEYARPLVLLHGGSARWQTFADLIPALAATRRVYALDLRGHGCSGWVPGRYRLRDYAADVAAFLQGCVGRPAVLFGHSLGGQVALLAAAEYPQLVRAAINGDSPLDTAVLRTHLAQDRPRTARWRDLAGHDRSLAAIAAALRDVPTPMPGREGLVRTADWLGEDNPWFDTMAESLHRLDPDMLTAVVDQFDEMHTGYDLETLLPRLACPVLLLQGDPAEGGMLTDAEVGRARELLPAVAHVRFTGIGHGLHMGQPEPVLRAVLDFLAERGV
jgi:pimeloyl-ACP methyl ester carboxylesterase